jgi:hypothetical protein
MGGKAHSSAANRACLRWRGVRPRGAASARFRELNRAASGYSPLATGVGQLPWFVTQSRTPRREELQDPGLTPRRSHCAAWRNTWNGSASQPRGLPWPGRPGACRNLRRGH